METICSSEEFSDNGRPSSVVVRTPSAVQDLLRHLRRSQYLLEARYELLACTIRNYKQLIDSGLRDDLTESIISKIENDFWLKMNEQRLTREETNSLVKLIDDIIDSMKTVEEELSKHGIDGNVELLAADLNNLILSIVD